MASGSCITGRDAEDEASEPPQPDQAGSIKAAIGSSAPVAAPPPAEKKTAPPTSSTKAIVVAGDLKRLPRAPVDKGSNPKTLLPEDNCNQEGWIWTQHSSICQMSSASSSQAPVFDGSQPDSESRPEYKGITQLLTSQLLEALMCSQDWIRNRYKGMVTDEGQPASFWSVLQEVQEGLQELTI